ncbi:MAG: hypothetical protein QOD86_2258 [Miltoncostaeaceae bacterium]|jgi:hypothetical protein|nr:hypothetical protein [Miltoncostaeaceae bacterium]
MAITDLSAALSRELDALRAAGCTVFGPGPVSFSESMPRGDAAHAGPGMHVQIGCGNRLVEGFGATPDEAVSDALTKLEGYTVVGRAGSD